MYAHTNAESQVDILRKENLRYLPHRSTLRSQASLRMRSSKAKGTQRQNPDASNTIYE
jgi:hypothetical protein